MKISKLFFFLFLLVPLVCGAQQKFEVFFDFDKYNLNETATEELDAWLVGHNLIEVVKIYGYCDWKGSNAYNDTLSVKRVREVYNFLRANNVSVRKDYEIRGFGENFEQSKIQDLNRKVVIVYEWKIDPQPTAVINDPTKLLQEKVNNAKAGDKIKLDDINFFNMSSRILPKSKTVLSDLLCIMQDNPTLKIEIQGHICCQIENDATDLSTRRAKAIYNFLVSRKINRKRLSYKGFGVTRPLHPIPELNEQQQDDNRRVEIMIVEK